MSLFEITSQFTDWAPANSLWKDCFTKALTDLPVLAKEEPLNTTATKSAIKKFFFMTNILKGLMINDF